MSGCVPDPPPLGKRCCGQRERIWRCLLHGVRSPSGRPRRSLVRSLRYGTRAPERRVRRRWLLAAGALGLLLAGGAVAAVLVAGKSPNSHVLASSHGATTPSPSAQPSAGSSDGDTGAAPSGHDLAATLATPSGTPTVYRRDGNADDRYAGLDSATSTAEAAAQPDSTYAQMAADLRAFATGRQIQQRAIQLDRDSRRELCPSRTCLWFGL